MHCPRCNTENPDQAEFCMNCAAPLALLCPQCGTELPPAAKFCFNCAAPVAVPSPTAPVAEPSPPALDQAIQRLIPKEFAERLLATRGQVGKERRIVTILFSDVKGSTAMAESLDPEDWTEIMEAAFDVLIEPIYRYEGTLARLMGDAILAFFGAPITYEDDPERACRAALEITAGAQRYAEKLERERGIQGFNVRVGIHTGLVVIGEVGSDLRVEYTAMGDAINLAARMESAAEPGTILITEETHKLISHLFDTEALGPIQVKGKAEPVSVYRVLAPKVAPSKLWRIAGLESPLVGREAEFNALQEATERLQAGVGGIVTIVGEAGIGKSRLVAEARKGVAVGAPRVVPLRWVEGRCLSYGTSIAYQLWLNLLRALLSLTAEDAPLAVRDALREQVQALCPERADDVYPYLARLMSLRPEPVEGLPLEVQDKAILRDLEGESLKAATFRAVEMLIGYATSDRPLVLVCEDLHWADPTSIDLLERLLALTDRTPLLFICLFRPERERGSWRIKETAARLYPHRHTDLWLDPLSTAESETLLSNLLRMPSLLKSFQERVLSYAEGNPFYVEEIIRSLIDSGIIVRDEATGSWYATRDLDEMPIPDTLHGVLMARIDRLPEDAKRILQTAAVIGRIFPHRLLAAIAQEQIELDAHLLTLQREQMIHERARVPELEYIFKHELTREAAYNGLLKKERHIFHRQVAEALQRLFPERIEKQLGLLAYHWERAADAKKATEYLLRAGDQARLLYSHGEAIDYYQRALRFLKERDQHEPAARTLMKLGLTYHNAFEFKAARCAYEEGFLLWQRAGEGQGRASPLPAPHALRLVSVVEPLTLDPGLVPGQALHDVSVVVADQLFSGLVDLTPEMDVVPDVARSWEVLEGGRKYVFHLRDDVCWSDGRPVTAHDFEYAWKRVLNPASGSRLANLLYDVEAARAYHQGELADPDCVGVRTLDDMTLVVQLEEPTSYFPYLLAGVPTYPVPRHALQAHGAAWTEVDNIVTNGPFRLVSREQGKSGVLERNPAYRGRFTGNVRRVELSVIGGPRSTLLQLYEDNCVDILPLGPIAFTEWDRVRQRYAGDYVSAPVLTALYIVFDVKRPPFDDPRVRRAFVLATDRETLADVTLRGVCFPATGGFVPPGMPGHSPGIGLPYDPEQARILLAEAGYPKGGRRHFPAVNAFIEPQDVAISAYLRAQWLENLGIEITWKKTKREEWVGSLHRQSSDRPHLWYAGESAHYPDPDSFLRVGEWRADTGWRNATYGRLVDGARRVMDQEERMRMYQQADSILVEEAPILPLFYPRLHQLVKPWVTEYPLSPLKSWYWKDVIIERH